jgi:Asp/Glu/hydantoin racemase
MKLCLVNVAAGSKDNEFVERLVSIWKSNFSLSKQKDTEIVSRFSPWGVIGMEGFFYHNIDTLNAQVVYHSAISAEKDGFDGILITCFGNPMLHQIRQAVNIPVVSIGEASLLMAASMGYKFGIVTISKHNILETKHTVAQYGLSDRLANVRAIPETPMEQGGAIFDATHSIEAFKKVAREIISDGAEIIIPGCGLMSPSLRLAPGAEKQYPNGVTEVDGAAVLDIMSCGIKMLESMVSLKRGGSSWISRKEMYAQPTPEALESGKIVLHDDRMTFWDKEM